MVLDEMQYMYLEIELEVKMSGTSRTSGYSSYTLLQKKFEIIQGTKDVDIDGKRVWNYQKKARGNYHWVKKDI